MLKLLGFLMGSASAALLLLALVAPPSWMTRADFGSAEPQTGALTLPAPRRPEPTAPAPPPLVASATAEPATAEPAQRDNALEAGQGDNALEAGQRDNAPDPGERDNAPEADSYDPANASVAAVEPDAPLTVDDDGAPPARWQAVWHPFTSEISARGFADRLGRLTGLDYRVESPERGRYQVVLAFSDAEELDAKLAYIEQVTGLSVASVQP